jgi:hypothetical protein
MLKFKSGSFEVFSTKIRPKIRIFFKLKMHKIKKIGSLEVFVPKINPNFQKVNIYKKLTERALIITDLFF